MTKYGTCYFPTRGNAIRYYRPYAKLDNEDPAAVVDRKLADGEIRIGELPPIKPGQQITIEDCRYHVADTLCSELLAAGVPIANHESDLYFQASEISRKILAGYPTEKANATTFRNQADPHKGETWFDVPFAFLPWWEARQSKKGSK